MEGHSEKPLKLTREDKKFLLQLSVSNRDCLQTIAATELTAGLTSSLVCISIASIIISFSTILSDGVIKEAVMLTGFFLLLLGLYVTIKTCNDCQEPLRGAVKLNKQYEKQLHELYPIEKYPEVEEYHF
jgi:hypothetical protein